MTVSVHGNLQSFQLKSGIEVKLKSFIPFVSPLLPSSCHEGAITSSTCRSSPIFLPPVMGEPSMLTTAKSPAAHQE
jgi:hypothetical protein